MRLMLILWYYFQVKRRTFVSRAALTAFQQKALKKLQRQVLTKNPYFKQHCQGDFSQWPLMNKKSMLAHFDEMNALGISLEEAYKEAMAAETSRNFKPNLQGHTIGLSSGTSGQRGVFLLSPHEERQWAGTILAKMLPSSLFSGEKIAFFLRANSNLYETVQNKFISFRFFDLFMPLPEQLVDLVQYQPSILIAPAQVLELIAKQNLPIAPKKVISVAEVLDDSSRAIIEQCFGKVHEIYQATEGFLASTCSLGHLHLNEDLVIVEEEKIDEYRFIPIITDLNRTTQPIVRYRLDDVLVKHPEPCPCGSPFLRLKGIEGRLNDTLLLPNVNGQITTVFADSCLRALARSLPFSCDFRLIQTDRVSLQFIAQTDLACLKIAQQALMDLFGRLGVDNTALQWRLIPEEDVAQALSDKRRKIQRHFIASEWL